MQVNGRHYRSVWMEGSTVWMINQRALPHRFEAVTCATYQRTAEAIRNMTVRGAGAIGAAAGFAVAQAALTAPEKAFEATVRDAARLVRSTRPTARDLFYAVEAVLAAVSRAGRVEQRRAAAAATATRLADENARAGEAIGRVGEPLIQPGSRWLTHCNAGWLAFVDWGSALAPLYHAHRLGKRPQVYATETRPRSQGAKLTAWELGQEGVAHTLVADTACGWLFQQRAIDGVMVGADRIAANGDTANKIGTYTLALLAHHHGVPFYVAAPRSTFDLATPSGETIVIEERDQDEVLWVSGVTAAGRPERVRVAAASTQAKNPAFDVTPAALIRAFVTDVGLVRPDRASIKDAVDGG